jgi:hypothetical protein
MPATTKKNKGQKTTPSAGAGIAKQPAAQTAERAAAAKSSGPRQPQRLKAGDAARRIRALAELSESLDARRRLRQLAKQIVDGPRNVQGIAFIEGQIGDLLDEAAACPILREQWLACEAATWGLAWLARTRRAGGSAGGLLERLVRLARSAAEGLHSRDTASARFVVALARLFCDIEACRCLETDAAAALDEEIARLVSEDGVVSVATPSGGGSAAAVDRVARWTAVRDVAVSTGGPLPWSDSSDARWRLAVRTALRLLGSQGRILSGAGRLPASFSDMVLRAADGDRTASVGRTANALRKPPKDATTGRSKRLLHRDLHAPDAATAILRTGWGKDSLRLMIDYRHPTPRLELATGERLLFDGPWQWRVSLEGRPLEADGPWTLSGFESDAKATFFEIVAPLAGGLQIERQVVLLPQDRVIVLSDGVTAASAASGRTIGYEGFVPTGSSLESEQAEETREVFVYDTSMRMMALPLALPEWTAASSPGSFTASADGLTLTQETLGGRLYAPLWIDCDPARFGRQVTWRQLTVADSRINLPRHQAVGFRVQTGLDQWLLYRSLDTPRNRTVLGCNLSCEFLLGRIGRKGVVSRTVEIQ